MTLPEVVTPGFVDDYLARVCVSLESRFISEDDYTRISHYIDEKSWIVSYSPSHHGHLKGLMKVRPITQDAKLLIVKHKVDAFIKENELEGIEALNDIRDVQRYIRVISSLCPYACKKQIQLAFRGLDFYRIIFNRYRSAYSGTKLRNVLWKQFLIKHETESTLDILELRDVFVLLGALSKEQYLINNNYYRDRSPYFEKEKEVYS